MNTVKILQISDTHLFENDELTLLGIKTNKKFEAVIAKIRGEDIHDTHMIFLTGDISQDETKASYQKAANYLSALKIPIYWIPGNHDHLPHCESVFKNAKNFFRTAQLSFLHWHVIFLNTKLEGADEGYLSPLELKRLNQTIASAPSSLVLRKM